MKVDVFVDRLGKSKTLDVKNIEEIFDKLEISSDEYIIVRNSELITKSAKLKDKDKLKFLSVISGG